MSFFISVIIPVYNAEKYLEECLRSIVSSSAFGELEVVLVNDGSKDGSGEICDSFSKQYKNIKAVHISNNGVSNARNVGIAESSGEYITFCDADDYYVNDILYDAATILKENKTDMLFYDFINEQQKSLVVHLPFAVNEVVGQRTMTDFFEYMLENESFNSVWNKLFRRDLLEINGITFVRGQKYGEDRDFVIKFLSVCETAYYLSKIGYFYRYVETSAVNKKRIDYFDNINCEMAFKLNMSKKFNISFSRVEQLVEESAARRIISSVFVSAENGYRTFFISIKSLYENDKLLELLSENKNKLDYNQAYKKVAAFLCDKKTLRCWTYINFLKLKEYIFKLIKG